MLSYLFNAWKQEKFEKIWIPFFWISSITLRDCKQTSWAGETNPSISVTGTSLQTKKDKETIKVEKMEMPNLPYSKSILLDRIKLMNK